MKVSQLPLTRLVLGTVAGIGLLSLLTAQPSWAEPYNQSNKVDPLYDLNDLNSQRNSNPFSNRGQGDSLSMVDFIRRASQGNGRSVGDYSAEQSENLDTAAAQFRARQQQQLQGQKQGTQENSITVITPKKGY